MQTPLTVLDAISIPTNCRVSWERMRGDDRARFCTVCNQTVHNLSSMSSSEAAAFVAANNYSVCIRLYRRPDGTVVTRDCEDDRSSRKTSILRRAIIAFASWLVITFIGGCNKCYQGSPVPPKRDGQVEDRKENDQGFVEPGAGAELDVK